MHHAPVQAIRFKHEKVPVQCMYESSQCALEMYVRTEEVKDKSKCYFGSLLICYQVKKKKKRMPLDNSRLYCRSTPRLICPKYRDS